MKKKSNKKSHSDRLNFPDFKLKTKKAKVMFEIIKKR